MRIRAALAIGVTTAAVVLPLQSASAVCVPPYTWVTGDCSPCTTVDGVARTLHDKLGTPAAVTHCVA